MNYSLQLFFFFFLPTAPTLDYPGTDSIVLRLYSPLPPPLSSMSTFALFHCSFECLEGKKVLWEGNEGETQIDHFALFSSPDKRFCEKCDQWEWVEFVRNVIMRMGRIQVCLVFLAGGLPFILVLPPSVVLEHLEFAHRRSGLNK